jgi:hypothetical protein
MQHFSLIVIITVQIVVSNSIKLIICEDIRKVTFRFIETYVIEKRLHRFLMATTNASCKMIKCTAKCVTQSKLALS